MLHVGLIPILGMLALVILCIVVLSRRSAGAARVREELDRRIAAIQQKDRQNDADLVANFLSGLKVDECFVRHAEVRGELFPRPLTSGQPWSGEELASWRKEQLADEVEAVNRRLLVPAFGIAAAIVAVCVVAVTILYDFNSSASALSSEAYPVIEFPVGDSGDPWADVVVSPSPVTTSGLELDP